MTPQQVSLFLSLLTIFAQVFSIIAFISLFWLKLKKVKTVVAKNALLISLIFALSATIGSLYYSEIAGYEPCKLCWLQRIFMYPLSLILGIALYKNDEKVSKYVIAMCIIGIFFASYHYLVQLTSRGVSCGDEGCAKRFVFYFGYITIPMMALTSFVSIFMSLILFRKK